MHKPYVTMMMLIVAFALIMGGALTLSCNSEVANPHRIDYVKDPRTGFCFALSGFNNGIAVVPCTQSVEAIAKER